MLAKKVYREILLKTAEYSRKLTPYLEYVEIKVYNSIESTPK
jgi:hypothetical protein